MVSVKRVYEPAVPSDGARFLVERLWPRGMKKESLRMNAWLKDIAPSSTLRRWFSPITAAAGFRRRYFAELKRIETHYNLSWMRKTTETSLCSTAPTTQSTTTRWRSRNTSRCCASEVNVSGPRIAGGQRDFPACRRRRALVRSERSRKQPPCFRWVLALCGAPLSVRLCIAAARRYWFPNSRLLDDAGRWVLCVPSPYPFRLVMRHFRVDGQPSRNSSLKALHGLRALHATAGYRSFAAQWWGVAEATTDTLNSTLAAWTRCPRQHALTVRLQGP